MKNNKRWTRILALCLAVVCLIGAVGAASLSYDLSLDGKTDVWDLQLAVSQGKTDTEKKAALAEALGGGDELHPNDDGVYEIYSVLGVYNMAKLAGDADAKFLLKRDVDMGGINWTPINFKGTLDGNGYAIQNMKVTKYHTAGDGYSQGFFANTYAGSVIRNLCIENISLDVSGIPDDQPTFVGLMAGSNRGTIQNCTTVGAITDERTNLTKKVYVGRMSGRNIKGSTLEYTADFNDFLDVSSGSVAERNEADTVDGIATKMAMFFAETTTKVIGLNGWAADGTVVDNNELFVDNWQDITNSTELVSETLQERRQTVAQYMYDMCTVYWTPIQNMTRVVYKENAKREEMTWKVGELYRGIPYNHGSSSMERFNYWIGNSELPADSFYFTDNDVIAQMNTAIEGGGTTTLTGRTVNGSSEVTTEVTTVDGQTVIKNLYSDYNKEDENGVTTDTDVTYENADIPSDWVSSKVTGTYLTGFGRYIGNDCSSSATWAWRQISSVNTAEGGVKAINTSELFASQSAINSYGFQAVNGLIFANVSTKDEDTTNDTRYDIVNAAYEADGGATDFLEALSHASMGDFVMGYQKAGGHTRMLMGDAVTIRKADGKIDPNLSYVITSEQGSPSTGTRDDDTAWTSTCKANYKYTFATLVRYEQTSDNTLCRYFPVTCAALHDENVDAAKPWVKIENGVVTSNFAIISTTVNENVIYTQTTGLSGTRAACTSVDVKTLHGITEGTVTVKIAGHSCTLDVTANQTVTPTKDGQ